MGTYPDALQRGARGGIAAAALLSLLALTLWRRSAQVDRAVSVGELSPAGLEAASSRETLLPGESHAAPALAAGHAHSGSVSAANGIRVASIFGSHMVLQRDVPIRVWGFASEGQRVHVSLGGVGEHVAVTGKDGLWLAELPARPAGGPLTLTISAAAGGGLSSGGVAETPAASFTDVHMGDVYLVAGQSNAEFGVTGDPSAVSDITDLPGGLDPRIRIFSVGQRTNASVPLRDFRSVETLWAPATRHSLLADGGLYHSFSALGWAFARELAALQAQGHAQRGPAPSPPVALGIISASWGGSSILQWMAPAALAEAGPPPRVLPRMWTSPASAADAGCIALDARAAAGLRDQGAKAPSAAAAGWKAAAGSAGPDDGGSGAAGKWQQRTGPPQRPPRRRLGLPEQAHQRRLHRQDRYLQHPLATATTASDNNGSEGGASREIGPPTLHQPPLQQELLEARAAATGPCLLLGRAVAEAAAVSGPRLLPKTDRVSRERRERQRRRRRGGNGSEAGGEPEDWGADELDPPPSPQEVAAAAAAAARSRAEYAASLAGPHHPDRLFHSSLYNALIHPLTVGPLGLRGVLWWQGENDHDGGFAGYYARSFPALVRDWRARFRPYATTPAAVAAAAAAQAPHAAAAVGGRGASHPRPAHSLPVPPLHFMFVLLEPYGRPWDNSSGIAAVRAAQLGAASHPANDLLYVSALDAGDPNSPHGNVHPRGKWAIGRRAARLMSAAQTVVGYRHPGSRGARPHLCLHQAASFHDADMGELRVTPTGGAGGPAAGGGVDRSGPVPVRRFTLTLTLIPRSNADRRGERHCASVGGLLDARGRAPPLTLQLRDRANATWPPAWSDANRTGIPRAFLRGFEIALLRPPWRWLRADAAVPAPPPVGGPASPAPPPAPTLQITATVTVPASEFESILGALRGFGTGGEGRGQRAGAGTGVHQAPAVSSELGRGEPVEVRVRYAQSAYPSVLLWDAGAGLPVDPFELAFRDGVRVSPAWGA